MVRVTNVAARTNKQGEQFIALELMGSLELIQSQSSGNFYATARRCSIPSTFTEDVARLMIGSTVDGEIVRIPCEPYPYTVKRTGEVLTLAYTYAYRPAGSTQLLGNGHVDLNEDVHMQASNLNKANSNGIRVAGLESVR